MVSSFARRKVTIHRSPFTIHLHVNHPLLYEINTRCWLPELSLREGFRVTLANVPESEFARWRELGFTHIWLMGVWSSGPLARADALSRAGLKKAYSAALPDWREADVVGSPYAIAEYKVPRSLGGDSGLSVFRDKLRAHGLKLVLDFVPNHVGLDHAWLRTQTDLFVQSPIQLPETFAVDSNTGVRWIAHGKDPYFPAWPDTAQFDYRKVGTRSVMKELLLSVADRCDGARCDMAMLLLNDVFARTWERFPCAGDAPAGEFWIDAIKAVRKVHPEFLFLAESYWGLEQRLQELGFDYTYDKELYDRIVAPDPSGAQRRLLRSAPHFVSASAHFLENHDEERAASRLSIQEHKAAALLILGLPGMRFLHEGQLDGRKTKTPVQLARRLTEAAQPEIEELYSDLLLTLPRTAVGRGESKLLAPRKAWEENPTAENFILVQWQANDGGTADFDLVVVNLAPRRSQCYAPLTIANLASFDWMMRDLLSMERHVRSGPDLERRGLYLDLPARGAQLFQFEPLGPFQLSTA
jgi:hypothetical protein